jgi:hypothetical protein
MIFCATILLPSLTIFRNSAVGQIEISGPILGYFFDEEEYGLRLIQGTAGTASVGKLLDLGFSLSLAEISPAGRYALGIVKGSGLPVLIDLKGAVADVRSMDGLKGEIDRIVISRSGSSAILFDEHEGDVTVVSGLPNNPQIIARLSTLVLSSALSALAISDEGDLILVGVAQGVGNAVYALRSRPGYREDLDKAPVRGRRENPIRTPMIRPVYLCSVGLATDIEFMPNGRDAIVADGERNEIIQLREVMGAYERVVVAQAEQGISRPVAVSIIEETARIFVANSGTGTVTVHEIGSRESSTLSCPCTPSTMQRLNGRPVFRLTAPGKMPMLLLDAAAGPRIVFALRGPQ